MNKRQYQELVIISNISELNMLHSKKLNKDPRNSLAGHVAGICPNAMTSAT